MNKVKLGIEEIKKLIPHRDPFLFVREVYDLNPEDWSGTGILDLSGQEGFFEGHFPGNPICPGVIIVEAMAQTAGVVGCYMKGSEGATMLFTSIENARFKRPVLPGDTVHVHVKKIFDRQNIWKYEAVAKVNGKITTTAIVSAIFLEPEKK